MTLILWTGGRRTRRRPHGYLHLDHHPTLRRLLFSPSLQRSSRGEIHQCQDRIGLAISLNQSADSRTEYSTPSTPMASRRYRCSTGRGTNIRRSSSCMHITYRGVHRTRYRTMSSLDLSGAMTCTASRPNLLQKCGGTSLKRTCDPDARSSTSFPSIPIRQRHFLAAKPSDSHFRRMVRQYWLSVRRESMFWT